MSGPTETIWKTLKSVIQMESRIELLATTAREQQTKIEALTERVIRLEAQMDMLLMANDNYLDRSTTTILSG